MIRRLVDAVRPATDAERWIYIAVLVVFAGIVAFRGLVWVADWAGLWPR